MKQELKALMLVGVVIGLLWTATAWARRIGVVETGRIQAVDGNGIKMYDDTPTLYWNLLDGGNIEHRAQGASIINEGVDTTWQRLYLYTHSTNYPYYGLYKARGTEATKVIVNDNDPTGYIIFYGWDGANWQATGYISSEVDGTPGAVDMPGALVFGVTADGAAGATEAMRISNDKSVWIDGAVTINDSGSDKDLRWESNSTTCAFFLEGSSGWMGLGTAAPTAPIEMLSTNANVHLSRFSAAAAGSPNLIMRSSRHATVGSHTTVADGHQLGAWSIQGSDGAAWRYAARIKVEADGGVGSSDMPGRIEFDTSPDGSATLATRMTIKNDGSIYMPDAPADDVAGGTPVDAFWDSATGQIGFNSSAQFNLDGTPNKINIREVPVERTAKFMGLQPRLYDRVERGRVVRVGEFGMTAEQVAEVMPEVVAYNRIEHVTTATIDGEEVITSRTFTQGDIPVGINYSQLTPRLVWMVQQQQTRIHAQAARITALEANQAAILARLDALERAGGVVPVAAGVEIPIGDNEALAEWLENVECVEWAETTIDVDCDITAARL